MDTERNTNPNQRLSQRIAQVDGLGRQIASGQNAKLVLDVLDPILEQRLGALLDQFQQCPPELGAILDFRAKIGEVWRLRKAVKTTTDKGASAEDALREILEQVSPQHKNGLHNTEAKFKEV